MDPAEGGVANAYDYPTDPINQLDLSGRAVCSGDDDVACNIGMNLASIFIGIGDTVTLCLLAGETSLTGLIRKGIGGEGTVNAAVAALPYFAPKFFVSQPYGLCSASPPIGTKCRFGKK